MFDKTMILAMTVLLGLAPARAQDASATASPNKHQSTLAVTVSADRASGQNGENLEDLLMVELANQPFLQIVDRQKLQDVLKEHAIALGNKPDAKEAITLGKFAGADYLLHVGAEKEKKTAAIRLVEVTSGQVKLETQVALTDDLALSTAAIREKVLAAVRPESQAANRLTVGIAAFPNRSGTDRSDKLGIELQKALRSRLKDETWAVVLERQYPTALLEEVDLARTGLVRDNTVEKLPPADLVILGSTEDADRDYEPGKPWAVKLDLTLRLRDKTSQSVQTYHSDAVEAAADAVMQKIDEFRPQQAVAQDGVSEKELWRRQALYLTPTQIETWISQDRTMWQNRVIIPNYAWSNEVNRLEVVRAWENLLLLDDRDAEAMNYLGAFLIGLTRDTWHVRNLPPAVRQAAETKCIAGSRLVERALIIQPTRERAASYVFCLRTLVEYLPVPARAREMAQYIVDHPEQFKESPDAPWIKIALAKPVRATEDGNVAELDCALSNAHKDPDTVLILFPPGLARSDSGKRYSDLLLKYLDSPEPVVQFAVHRALGEMLCWQEQDPSGLEDFDKAIAAMEAAYARCKSPHRDSLNNIYRLRIEACKFLNRPEEAKKTALAGAQHFREVGRLDNSIAWLYDHCVTEVLGVGEERQSLAICDAYMASIKDQLPYFDYWFHISAKREELLAKLAGKHAPDMGGLQFVKGTQSTGLKWIRMAATERKLWFTSSQIVNNCEQAMLYEHGQSSASGFLGTKRVTCVATTKDAVFFGGMEGLYKLDTNGKLLKRYNRDDASFPGYRVTEIREADGNVFFAFLGSSQSGIAVLDPIADRISVLAPSSHEATWDTEPVLSIRRIWWDAATPRLYACAYFSYGNEVPFLTRQYGWSPPSRGWQRYPITDAPRFVLSDMNETLRVRILDNQTEFQFVKAGQKVTADVPVPAMIGEPAWDERRIWVPTSSGLYEVDRATGRMTWLAYEDGNWFLSLLRAGNVLYVATSRGLYYREISPTPAREVATRLSPNVPAKLASEPTALPSSKPATAVTTTESIDSGISSAAFPVEVSLEDDAHAEVTVVVNGQESFRKVIMSGKTQLDLAAAGNGQHHVFFHCPGYASQWVYLKITEGKVSPEQAKVALFRKRYVILRCAFNTIGQRNIEGDSVEEQHLASPHWTGPEYFNRDWQMWQRSSGGAMFGDTPYLDFHRYCTDFGFTRPPAGISYEQMKEAPASGYRCECVKAEKGLVLYCRVNGNTKDGLGYGKILVEAVTETPPEDVRTIERP